MKLSFIGCGNMATAMIRGILESGKMTAEDITVSSKTVATREKAQKELGVRTAETNAEAAAAGDVVFLAVKPQQYELVINEIREALKPEQIVVSIAPGKTIAWFKEKFGKDVKLVRTSPNTPALVKEGMTAICANEQVTAEECRAVVELYESFGKVEEIPESMMDAVLGAAGSSPAYVYMFIEAMADAAVAEGLPRAKAYKFAAQTVLGSAKMVLETGRHPGDLKDMVCSPAGTTIEGVQVLEESGMRAAVMKAVRATVKKAKQV